MRLRQLGQIGHAYRKPSAFRNPYGSKCYPLIAGFGRPAGPVRFAVEGGDIAMVDDGVDYRDHAGGVRKDLRSFRERAAGCAQQAAGLMAAAYNLKKADRRGGRHGREPTSLISAEENRQWLRWCRTSCGVARFFDPPRPGYHPASL